MCFFTLRISILATFCFTIIYCYLEGIPEKVEIPYAHPDHIENFTLKVKRYGRKSGYYIAGQGILKNTWNNNATMFLETYEYLHNEYRLSFMSMRMKLCDLIEKDILIGAVLRNRGFVCPLEPGVVVFKNISLRWNDFPYEFPFLKGLANITVKSTKTNEELVNIRVFVRVKQDRRKKS